MLSSGVRLGRYEVVRLLAIGGMAEIYLARALGPEGWRKRCVLKRLNPDHADRRDFHQMFHDEARLAAYLHHQNVVQVGMSPEGHIRRGRAARARPKRTATTAQMAAIRSR